MRSTCSIISKAVCLCLALCLLCPAGLASSMGDTLSLGMISVKTVSLNPLASEEREFQSLTALLYEGLYSLDDDYMPQLCLAKECESTADGKRWTIRLRPDAVFHDGTPCTAYDVEATIQEILRLAEEGKGQYNQLKFMIASVSVNSADSLQITVKRPYYGIKFALTFPVLPRGQVQSAMPAGTGPFQVTGFVPADYLYLSANPNWWQGTPSVKNIDVHFYATNRELISAYEYNTIDAAVTRSASAGQYQTGLTNLNITYRTRQLETLLFNYREFPLENELVRKAIRYAIDFDAIANTVYMGMATRTDTPMAPGTWMYRDFLDGMEYNPDKAKELLAQAGWERDMTGDGVLNTVVDGKMKRLQLRIYVYEEQDNSVRVQVAGMIKDYLAAVGISAPVETANYATIADRLNARNFDMCIAAFQMDTTPDPGFLLMSGNTCNYGNYKSAAMDSLFKKLREEREFANYQQLLWQIQEQYAQDCPFVCMWYRCGALLTRKVFTTVRDVREPEILRGIETTGTSR